MILKCIFLKYFRSINWVTLYIDEIFVEYWKVTMYLTFSNIDKPRNKTGENFSSGLGNIYTKIVSQNQGWQTQGHLLSNFEWSLLPHQLRQRLCVKIIEAQSSCLLSGFGQFQPGAKEASKRWASAKEKEDQLNQNIIVNTLALICLLHWLLLVPKF